MDRIIDEAAKLYGQYGADDLDYVAGKLGVGVQEVLESEGLKEVYFADLRTVVVKPGLPRHERRYLLAHALGHHIFHGQSWSRDFVGLHEDRRCGSLELGKGEVPRSEREADLFAGYLLVPEVKLRPVLEQAWVREVGDPVLKLALEFGVPVELMRERLIFEGLRR